MGNFKIWFKTTAFYYWPVFVWLPAFKAIFMSPDAVGKIKDTVLGLIVTVILSIITVFIFRSGGIYQSINSNVKSFSETIGASLIIYLIIRFLANLIYIPSKLHFEMRKKQDRRIWEDIDVRKKVIRNKKISYYGIEVENNKAFDILRAYIVIRYIEIDGILYSTQESYRLAVQSSSENSSKLSWKGNDPLEPTGVWINKDGGKAFAYSFDVNQNNNIPVYKIRYFEFSEKDGKLMPIVRDVKNYVKCEFTCFLKYMLPNVETGSDVYNFEIMIEGNGVKMRLNKGAFPDKLPIEG